MAKATSDEPLCFSGPTAGLVFGGREPLVSADEHIVEPLEFWRDWLPAALPQHQRDACLDAYSDWLAAHCAQSGGRIVGVPILPTVYRPERTADAIALSRPGFRTMMLPNYPRSVRYGDDSMRPLWSAIEASGLPLSFHISEAPDGNGPGELGSYLMVSFQPFRKLWSYLVFSGIFDRHPGVRIVFVEGGISWIPSALDHADRIARRFRDHLEPRLARAPSYYWHAHCWATFMDDPRGLEQIDFIWADRVLSGSDYPHPEGTQGETQRILADIAERVGPTAGAAIAGGNARGVYGLA